MYNRNLSDSASDESSSRGPTSSIANESKYVADILSSMANGEPAAPTYTLPAYASGVATGTTPTLTPTTLANIEQTFIELQSVPVSTSVQDPLTQSGFVPPIVDPISGSDHTPGGTPDHYDYSDSSDQEWMGPSVKSSRQSNGKGMGTSSGYPSGRGRKRRGDDSDLEYGNASPEEVERRRVRRERNKVAAAKCRQRRVDHTNRLITETDKLEDEKSSLESEIQQLQQQKEQLKFILQAHKPLCKADGVVEKSRVKAEYHSSCGAEADHSNRGAAALPNGLTTIKQEIPDYIDEYNNHCSRKADQHSMHPCSRPSSLPLQSKPIMSSSLPPVSLSSATGISITTPSSGFFSFSGMDMVDGHSGLTPLGGPSCASQIHRSSVDNSPDGVTSPTLISL